ncbi:hypothetical protein BV22DRAFT_1027886, partial [Leucogyrophana mollusca]
MLPLYPSLILVFLPLITAQHIHDAKVGSADKNLVFSTDSTVSDVYIQQQGDKHPFAHSPCEDCPEVSQSDSLSPVNANFPAHTVNLNDTSPSLPSGTTPPLSLTAESERETVRKIIIGGLGKHATTTSSPQLRTSTYRRPVLSKCGASIVSTVQSFLSRFNLCDAWWCSTDGLDSVAVAFSTLSTSDDAIRAFRLGCAGMTILLGMIFSAI